VSKGWDPVDVHANFVTALLQRKYEIVVLLDRALQSLGHFGNSIEAKISQGCFLMYNTICGGVP
jgi:hypothetical protein